MVNITYCNYLYKYTHTSPHITRKINLRREEEEERYMFQFLFLEYVRLCGYIINYNIAIHCGPFCNQIRIFTRTTNNAHIM